MDEPVKTGHVYPAGAQVFEGTEDEAVYRERNATLVEALRSGVFVQARGALEVVTRSGYRVNVVGNCCLGVACRIVEREADTFSVISRITEGTVNFGTLRYDEDGKAVVSSLIGGYPPSLVQQWFGWERNNPELYLDNNIVDTLSAAYLNDNYGMDFTGIADAFERTFVTFTYEPDEGPTGTETAVFTDLPA